MTALDRALGRVHGLHPRLIDLSLGRLERLLMALGHPERRLPPVIHVAGTNGKGSTCAFLRAMGEAAGLRVHVYTSPHLVRFAERVRLAGELAGDDVLAEALEEVERVNAGAAITVFEVITAAALVLFAQVPAELCVIEVGLGGRFDATNVIARPVACAITSVSLDHGEFLGTSLAEVAFEKAGIMKPGVPVATGWQAAAAGEVLAARAAAVGAPLLRRGLEWEIEDAWFRDASGQVQVSRLGLPGVHQRDNAGVALAALRASGLAVGPAAMTAGLAAAEWPARMQRLSGRLAALLPAGWELWLDGGHNPGAGLAIAEHVAGWGDRPVHLVVGMKQSKDAAAFLAPLVPRAASLWAVVEPGQHLALPVAAIVAASGGVARPAAGVADALRGLSGPPARVLVCGSLYLAGEVLKLDAAATSLPAG